MIKKESGYGQQGLRNMRHYLSAELGNFVGQREAVVRQQTAGDLEFFESEAFKSAKGNLSLNRTTRPFYITRPMIILDFPYSCFIFLKLQNEITNIPHFYFLRYYMCEMYLEKEHEE